MTDPVFKTKVDEETPSFGRFIIEPLEQGYGQTLGNSLRRVLLTSLPGAAITSVAMEGVKHQFSTFPGLKEDVSEFLLNVKKIRLHIEGDEEVKMSLHKNGPGKVTAGDIDLPAGTTITNPDLILGTLADKKSDLSMQLTAQKGFGYVPVEDNREQDSLGMIPVDALYSPILRVNYRIEATRVGRMTNLDKLVLEVWTDGTTSPSDAVKFAAKVLVAYFMQVIEPKVQNVEEAAPAQTAVSEEILKMRIEEFDIPTRIVNALAKGGIETIGQLLGAPKEELMKVKNLGTKSLEVVESKLKEKGITLSL